MIYFLCLTVLHLTKSVSKCVCSWKRIIIKNKEDWVQNWVQWCNFLAQPWWNRGSTAFLLLFVQGQDANDFVKNPWKQIMTHPWNTALVLKRFCQSEQTCWWLGWLCWFPKVTTFLCCCSPAIVVEAPKEGGNWLDCLPGEAAWEGEVIGRLTSGDAILLILNL